MRCIPQCRRRPGVPGAAPPVRVVDNATGAYRHPVLSRREGGRADINKSKTVPAARHRRAGSRVCRGANSQEIARTLGTGTGSPPTELHPQQDFRTGNRVGAVYDSGNYERAVSRALGLTTAPGLRARQQGPRRGNRQGRTAGLLALAWRRERGRGKARSWAASKSIRMATSSPARLLVARPG